MSIGTFANFVIYQPQFWSGVIEVLQRQTGVFNEASQGALIMEGRFIKGDYEQQSFLKYTGSLVVPRDTTSTATVTDIALNQGEMVGVKVNRRIGPVAMSNDAFRKAGFDPKVFSLQVGEQVGPEIMGDYSDSLINSVAAAVKAITALNYDATADTLKTMNHAILPKAFQKFGDRASRLLAFVMHSKPYYDLVGQAIADKIVNVADLAIAQGSTATLGRPVVITDSPSLTNLDASGNITSYNTLVLSAGAGTLTESEERDVELQRVTGLANLVNRLQGEHAFNLAVKGCAWDITNGGKNPSNTALGTSSNWDKVVNDNKQMPGVLIKTQ
jgi:hypothetical protein